MSSSIGGRPRLAGRSYKKEKREERRHCCRNTRQGLVPIMHLGFALYGVHALTEPLCSKAQRVLMLVVLTSDEMHELPPCTLGAFFAQRAAELRRETIFAVTQSKI